jgi:hypothetical protein
MTNDQILNYGHYMTVGHGWTCIVLFMGCQEKSAGHWKIFCCGSRESKGFKVAFEDKGTT